MFTPSVALTSQNVGFVAWNEFTGACGRIWVNRNASATWGAPTEIGTAQAISPQVAANDGGDALVVWVEREWELPNCAGAITGNEVWGNRYSAASGTWSGPFRISVDAQLSPVVHAFSPVATLDSAGRATVVWIQDGHSPARNVWYSHFNGAWSPPALLSNSPRTTGEPALGVDLAGNVIAVWVQDTNPFDPSQTAGGPALPNIWAARFNPINAIWETPALIGTVTLSGSDGTERPRLAVNTAGNAVAVWRESSAGVSSIMAARFSVSFGTWSVPLALDVGVQYADWPGVAIDVNGNAQAVWTQKIDAAATNESGFTARLDGASGLWGAPQLIEQATELVSTPRVGMQDSGRALIAWRQAIAGTPPIHAAHLTAGTFGAQTHFPGDGLALAVNASGTALLASEVSSFENTIFGISIRAAIFRP
jgi:hypothetical protein